MGSINLKTTLPIGNQLVDDISLSTNSLNILFSALFLTAAGVFIGANLLLLDIGTIEHSAQIALPCVGLLLTFYAASYQTKSILWGLVLTYGVLWILVHSHLAELMPAIFLIFLASVFYVLRFLRVQRKNWSRVVFMASISTSTIISLAFVYTSFDMLPRLNAGNVHQDTLFHAAIASMIKNYGISSTGLHGLVEIPYHTFSHTLMAGISLISGLGVIEVYGVANSVFFAPILIFSISALCLKLDRNRELPESLVWAAVSVLLVLFPFIFHPWGVWSSYFVSESYLVSLGIFTLGLSLLFKKNLTWADLLLLCFTAAMIANAKASVALIFACLWFVRLSVSNSFSRIKVLASCFSVFLVTAWVVFDSAQTGSGLIKLNPLHFIRFYSLLGADLNLTGHMLVEGKTPPLTTLVFAFLSVFIFYLFHFVFSWILIGCVAFKGGFRAIFYNLYALYLLAATFISMMIVSMFEIPGGSAYYFSNVAFFLALPALVYYIVLWISQRGTSCNHVSIYGAFLILLLGAKGIYGASWLSSTHFKFSDNELIFELQRVRADSLLNTVWEPNQNIMKKNPVKKCTAKPFLYPTISERPWLNVINDEKCEYYAYGYELYGINSSNKQINVQARLMPNMIASILQ